MKVPQLFPDLQRAKEADEALDGFKPFAHRLPQPRSMDLFRTSPWLPVQPDLDMRGHWYGPEYVMRGSPKIINEHGTPEFSGLVDPLTRALLGM